MDKDNENSTETIELSIPVIGLIRGIWVMCISAAAFIGVAFVFTYAVLTPSFNIIGTALIGSLLAFTAFGAMFGVSRYFAEEQIKYTAINMKLK
jgi:hypothetical protein